MLNSVVSILYCCNFFLGKKLAEKLGLESVEELEVALDAMDGIADDGGELAQENLSREARVRAAYMEWCKDFGKETDEARFETFSSNYLAMEQYAQENGKSMQLNKFADCTEEEYVALASGVKEAEDAKAAAEAEKETAAKAIAEEKAAAESEAKKSEEEAAAKNAAAEAEKEAAVKSAAAEADAKKAEEEAATAKNIAAEADAKKAEEEAAAKKAAAEAKAKKEAEASKKGKS
jgi:hypothetical protein